MTTLFEIAKQAGVLEREVAIPKPMFPHQVFSVEFYMSVLFKACCDGEAPGVLNTSKCGTGKTRGIIEFVKEARRVGYKEKVMVLAPLTILEPSWGQDIDEFAPELTYSVC